MAETGRIEHIGIATGVHGRAKLRLLQCHRLLVFESTFDAYLRGECSAERVRYRAKLMLQAGLPDFVRLRRR